MKLQYVKGKLKTNVEPAGRLQIIDPESVRAESAN